jgi:hypothetical protein
MPIELLCPGCNQLLRVPDAAAGKAAKCPKCATVLTVPTAADPPPSSDFGFGASEPKPGNPGAFSAPRSQNPFSDPTQGASYGVRGPNQTLNPYASPTSVQHDPTFSDGTVGHRIVDIGEVFRHAMEVWQRNLGLLVGTTFIVFLLTMIGNWISQGIQVAMVVNNQRELGVVFAVLFGLLNFGWQTYLGIGQAQIALKLARNQSAELGELFGGAPRFLSVLGFFLLLGLAVYLPLLGMIGISAMIGGDTGGAMMLGSAALWTLLMIPVALFFWPTYYLVVDGRSSVWQSFGAAVRISEGNKLTIFLVMLSSVAIMLLGVLAVCIGVLFAAPLVSLMWASAYLMMSGQAPALARERAAPQQMYR